MSDGPQMIRDLDTETMQMSFHDTENTQTLDGSSTAAASTVISANELTVVRLIPQAFGEAWYKRGASPTAATDDGVYFNNEIYVPLDKGEKVSIIGAKVNLTILKKDQS